MTTERVDTRSVIHDIHAAIREAKMPKGLVTLQIPEPGAGFFICEPLEDLLKQFKEAANVFLEEGKETKTRRGDVVHISPRVKAEIFGRSLTIPFENEKLFLIPREEVMLIDFETTARRREFLIQVFGETPPETTTQKQPPRR